MLIFKVGIIVFHILLNDGHSHRQMRKYVLHSRRCTNRKLHVHHEEDIPSSLRNHKMRARLFQRCIVAPL